VEKTGKIFHAWEKTKYFKIQQNLNNCASPFLIRLLMSYFLWKHIHKTENFREYFFALKLSFFRKTLLLEIYQSKRTHDEDRITCFVIFLEKSKKFSSQSIVNFSIDFFILIQIFLFLSFLKLPETWGDFKGPSFTNLSRSFRIFLF